MAAAGALFFKQGSTLVAKVISMDRPANQGSQTAKTVRDRRFAIRFPFAADAQLLNLESGERTSGITSDISMGGCFVCSSKPLAVRARVRLTLVSKNRKAEILATVRVVKPRIGMGLEFLDLDSDSYATLASWIDSLKRNR
jgi:hypothetical protein